MTTILLIWTVTLAINSNTVKSKNIQLSVSKENTLSFHNTFNTSIVRILFI